MSKVLFVGLDVHGETIAVAVAEQGKEEVRSHRAWWGTLHSAKRLSAPTMWPLLC
ncbi:MAG TPA: hypothetical protein VMZ52_13470 [Bryobacteraceae bacterium]|nr:hypothetical protein [Bryobacteraceae bacterium]